MSTELVKKFRVIIPAELSKSSDGDWIVQGLASTPSRDQQGEVILQDGIDATPIDQGRGVLNWDHQRGPENVVGLLDSYKKTPKGLFVKGRLLKNHTKAKAIHEIMSSLGKSDHGRMGLSVEGKILERAGKDGKIIRKCQISAVALTMNPVNQESYVDLVKSLATDEVDFQATEENAIRSATESANLATFTTEQVVSLIKTLGVGNAGATVAPGRRSGGDDLAQEELDKKPKKLELPHDINRLNDDPKKNLKKMSKSLYKSTLGEILNKIQVLYPDASRSELWKAVKDRLNKKFPDLDNIAS
jgi:hypothetical protein